MRGQVQVGDFHISTTFHQNWPYRWSVRVEQSVRATKTRKTWTAWQDSGRWFGRLAAARARMDAAEAQAEAYINQQVARSQ